MGFVGTAHHLAELAGSVLAKRYVLGAPLGEGAGSGVFEARDLRTDRIVAVKLLAVADADARLRRESLAARVEHPGVCAPFDVGQQNGVPFVVCERLRGQTLGEAIVESGPLPIDLVASVFVDLLSALAAVHVAGIVHRDVKPSNVFLARREGCRPFARLFDFGCATEMHAIGDDAIVGTPAYMAPEQGRGGPSDARTDVYAIGMSLFEAVAGRRPYAAPGWAQIVAGRRAPPPDVRAIRPNAPRALAAIIARATASAPHARFASAGEMQARLAALGVRDEYVPRQSGIVMNPLLTQLATGTDDDTRPMRR
ncbi:MAG TPA: serine/threonine-protein kinase [Labilithrix sp.]|jgi:serine/threonine-protein kinase